MEQIKEAYVSFEVAKLLKEKGFPQDPHICNTAYTLKGKLSNNAKSFVRNYNVALCNKLNIKPKTYTIAPTQQMAMDWLRLKHKLCVVPYRTACGYLYLISNIPYGTTLYSDYYNGDDEDSGQWTKWELACDAGIKYCLENLIK